MKYGLKLGDYRICSDGKTYIVQYKKARWFGLLDGYYWKTHTHMSYPGDYSISYFPTEELAAQCIKKEIEYEVTKERGFSPIKSEILKKEEKEWLG